MSRRVAENLTELIEGAQELNAIAAEICGVDVTVARTPAEVLQDRHRVSSLLLLAAWAADAEPERPA